MNICVVGMGLIGGSVCKAVREYTTHRIYGVDTDPKTVQAALEDGVVDGIIEDGNYAEIDMTIVCLYPYITAEFLKENMSRFKKDSIVCDFCGIKSFLVQQMTDLAKKFEVRYVSAHPMSGREVGGYANSLKTLYVGKNFIITPVSGTDVAAVKEVALLATQMGVTKIVQTTPEEHDKIIAYTSQLAHIVSSAYVKSPTIEEELGFTGGSFQDMTRVATVNESMWTSLFLLNRDALLSELNMLIENLSLYKDALEQKNDRLMYVLLRDGRLRKEENLRNDPNSI